MSSSVAMESLGGHVSHPVVDAGDGVGDKWGCFIDMSVHGQGAHEASSDGGSGCTEFVCPAHGRVLSHQVATWVCQRFVRCSNMR